MSEYRGHTPITLMYLVFHPDTSASSLLFTSLFRRLAQAGAQITVLCGFPSKDSVDAVVDASRRERFEDIEVIRCGIRLEGKRNLLTRAIAYGSFLIHASIKVFRLRRRSRIVGGTDPPFAPIMFWMLSLIGNFKYDLVIHDLYPDSLVAVGALRDKLPFIRLWRLLNRWSFHRAEHVVVIGRDMEWLLRERYAVPSDRIVLARLWGVGQVDTIRPTDDKPLLQILGLQNKFVVQYAGNMGLLHDIDAIVSAAAHLRHEASIHFLLIGKGVRRGAAERLSCELGLTNITWMDFIAPNKVHEALASCDVSLVSLRKGLEGVAVPSKLYVALASGRAIIGQAPLRSEVAYVIKEESCGIVVEPGDSIGLATAILQLATDRDGTRSMGHRARAAYESKYTLDQAVDTFGRLWNVS